MPSFGQAWDNFGEHGTNDGQLHKTKKRQHLTNTWQLRSTNAKFGQHRTHDGETWENIG